MGLFGVIAPLVSKRFTKLFGEKKVLIATSLLFLAYGFSVVLANSLILLVGLFLFAGFVLDLEAPVWNTYFHRFAPSKMRATITSFSSMMMALAGIISLPIAGILVDSIGGRYTIFIAALLSIPVIILYSMIKEPKSVEVKH
jgi:MFS family permease